MKQIMHAGVVFALFSYFLLAGAHAADKSPISKPVGLTNRYPELDALIPSVQLTNGLRLGLSALRLGTGTNTTDTPISVLLKDPRMGSSVVYMPRVEYLARLELCDSNGLPVPKTTLGREYGRSFDQLFWELKLANQPHGHPEMVGLRKDWVLTGESLPKVSDLFAISDPGTYRLKAELQVLLLYLGQKQVRQVVRFPPIELMLTRQ